MTSFKGTRKIKRIAGRVLPGVIKNKLKRYVHGARSIRPKTPFTLDFEPVDGEFIVTVDSLYAFVIPRYLRLFYEEAFLNNANLIAEMEGFMRAGKRARKMYDIGAAHSVYSLIFCALNDQNRVMAFEPGVSQACAARKLIDRNGYQARISLQQLAMGDTEGTSVFYEEGSGGVQTAPSSSGERHVVETTTVDAQCRCQDGPPDLLKIDVEGFEWEVLNGATEVLSKHKPTICLELHLDFLENRGIDPAVVCELLESFDYRFYDGKGASLATAQICGDLASMVRFVAAV
jgi:FkbM family methyltransferase